METQRNYQRYLTGLKGLACLLIMIGHFIGLYRVSQSFTPRISILDAVLESPLAFFIDEGWWLYLFFVISGFLVAQSSVNSLRDLLKKCINRFFRLALPILFSYLVIYSIYLVVGFHNTQTLSIFQCDWFQKYFRDSYTLRDVLLSPVEVLLRGNVVLNRPYWVLKMMFFSSMLIYFLKYIYQKLCKTHESLCFHFLLTITLASILISPIMCASLVGMLVAIYKNQIHTLSQKPFYAFWVMVVAMLLYILPKTLLSAVFFAAIIIYLPRIKILDNIFSSRPFQFLGNISWGVYSFHWPLICSVGALIMLSLYQSWGTVPAYLFGCCVSAGSTLVLSVAFFFTFEKLSGWLTKQIGRAVTKLIG